MREIPFPVSFSPFQLGFGPLGFFLNFIYLFLTALGLGCFTWAFSSCGERGLLSHAVLRLIAVTSLVEHRSRHTGFSSYSVRSQQLQLPSSRTLAQ